MRLERLRLKSFGCFEQQDFHLSDGINLIFGPNFSGKSTLVNAIFFTLTGKPIVPKVDAGAMKNPKSRTGTAGLQFVFDDKRFMLFRGTGKRIQLRYEKDGEWFIELDDNRVTIIQQTLKERFGIIHDRIALTSFLREGEIFEFLARQPATRRDILYTLLGIDKLLEVREKFIDARRFAKREWNRIKSHQNSLRYTAQKTHKTEIEKIEANLKKLDAAYERETGDVELIAELKQKQKQLQTKLDSQNRERTDILGNFNGIEQINEMITNIEEALKENDGLDVEREKLIQKIGSYNSQITTIENTCNTLQSLIDNDEGNCPTCHQKVEKDVLAKIIDEKETEKIQLSKELEAHKKILGENTENVESIQELKQRLQTLQAMLIRLEPLEKDIRNDENELKTLNTRLSEMGVTAEMEDIVTEFKHESPNSNSDTNFVDKGQLKKDIDRERKKLEKLKQEEAVHLDRLELLKKTNIEAEQVERTTLSIELACDGVDKTIQSLQRQILKPAEVELHRWVEQMKLFGRTNIDLQKDHLLPTINIDGVDRSLMLLSGSEKMFLYLSFKVALAKVLGNTGFFVFDDPTLHLDGERKALMVDFIRQIASEYQVVVTSYDEDVRAELEGANLIEMRRE